MGGSPCNGCCAGEHPGGSQGARRFRGCGEAGRLGRTVLTYAEADPYRRAMERGSSVRLRPWEHQSRRRTPRGFLRRRAEASRTRSMARARLAIARPPGQSSPGGSGGCRCRIRVTGCHTPGNALPGKGSRARPCGDWQENTRIARHGVATRSRSSAPDAPPASTRSGHQGRCIGSRDGPSSRIRGRARGERGKPARRIDPDSAGYRAGFRQRAGSVGIWKPG
jgi:hypothetical protein